jgi:hypothetical protein
MKRSSQMWSRSNPASCDSSAPFGNSTCRWNRMFYRHSSCGEMVRALRKPERSHRSCCKIHESSLARRSATTITLSWVITSIPCGGLLRVRAVIPFAANPHRGKWLKFSLYESPHLPGERINPDILRMDTDAVLHLPLTTDARRRRGGERETVTSSPSLEKDLCNARADWVNEEAVEDRGLVTSHGRRTFAHSTSGSDSFSPGPHVAWLHERKVK